MGRLVQKATKTPNLYCIPMRVDLVEKAAQVIPDVHLLINAVSMRVKQLTRGHQALVERKPGMREADVALLELIEGKIKIVQKEALPVFE
jgi:DNA-directed RNA polymerase subunit omega